MAAVTYDGWITVPYGWNAPIDAGAITSTGVALGNSASNTCVGCVLYATETMTVTNIAMCCTATAGTVNNKTIVACNFYLVFCCLFYLLFKFKNF